MRLLLPLCLLASLLLAGCDQAGPHAKAPLSEAADGAAGAGPAGAAAPGAPGAKAAAPAPRMMLAYAYSYRLELPAEKARSLMARHQLACEAAGPALCQLVSADIGVQNGDDVRGELALRAQPAWLKSFRGNLSREARDAGGNVLRDATETEDLTRQMVDTEAALRAQTALQSRLERLLAERPGSLADALAIEKELARVGGEIDATRSGLAVMRGRVEMSKLTIDYLSRGAARPDGVMSPVVDALRNFVGNTMKMVGLLIGLLSFVFPVALVVVPMVWWLLRRSHRPRPSNGPPVNLES